MRVFRFRLCRIDRRLWKGLSLLIATIFNLIFALVLIYSILSFTKYNQSKDQSNGNYINKLDEFKDENINKTIENRRIRKEQYDYYFRLNYEINEASCKSIETFNTLQNLISIENFTNTKLQSLFSDNLTIQIDIFSIKPKLLKTEKIQKNSLRKWSRTVCDYLIELSIGFDFGSTCDQNCKNEEVRRLTTNTKPFERQTDSITSFIYYPLNNYDSMINFQINQIFLYQTSIFLDRPIYIQSFYEVRYVSALIVDPEGFQSSVTMSQIDRTLFIIKDGLYEEPYSKESTTIYISFLLPTVSNTYLRHESARIKLTKSDQSTLFKQDATFKLLYGTTRKDVVAFESINLPQYFIGVDPDSQTALVLTQPPQLFNDIELLDQRFLFKLVFNQ